MRGWLQRLGFCAAFLLALVQAGAAAELVMYRRESCPWCRAWDQAIGPIYGKSDLGRRLPLRLVDLDTDPMPAIALKLPVRYTPTFVVAEDGREIGRIEGYPGEDFFWARLDGLAGELPPGREPAASR